MPAGCCQYFVSIGLDRSIASVPCTMNKKKERQRENEISKFEKFPKKHKKTTTTHLLDAMNHFDTYKRKHIRIFRLR